MWFIVYYFFPLWVFAAMLGFLAGVAATIVYVLSEQDKTIEVEYEDSPWGPVK